MPGGHAQYPSDPHFSFGAAEPRKFAHGGRHGSIDVRHDRLDKRRSLGFTHAVLLHSSIERATPFEVPHHEAHAGAIAMADALPELPAWMCQSVEALGIELASIEELRGEIEEAMIAESRRHPISRILRTAPGLGPIRAAQLIPIVITPHRFRTKRQFWAYCGCGLVTRTSSDWAKLGGR